MALVVPNPTVPTNGQSLDATPLLANLNAVYQAIQSFDGSQIQAATIQAAALAIGINPNTLLKETLSPFVVSGLVWSTVSGLNGTMTAGTAYIANATQMFRVAILSVASNTFAASKDIYIDIDVNGNITYNAVANGAAAPALTANSIRIAKVVTSGAAITSFTQVGSDGLGNIIYPLGGVNAKAIQNPYKFSVYLAGNQTGVADSVQTKVLFDTAKFDTGNNVDLVTNKGRFTAPVAGFYQISTFVSLLSGANNAFEAWINIFKNGVQFSKTDLYPASTGISIILGGTLSQPIQLAAGDYLEIFAWQDVNTGTSTILGSTTGASFSGFLISTT